MTNHFKKTSNPMTTSEFAHLIGAIASTGQDDIIDGQSFRERKSLIKCIKPCHPLGSVNLSVPHTR